MNNEFQKRKNTIYKKNDFEVWDQFLEARDSGEQIEIDQEMYFHWLDILPPLKQGNDYFTFAEDFTCVIRFWQESGRGNQYNFYCQNTFRTNQLY
ncbi:MAG: hypothetical protein HOP07_14900 [Bacteriovoracaceae bacterium]|nr:hypothetical protein [Bacteriovoracaceae bacterium]